MINEQLADLTTETLGNFSAEPDERVAISTPATTFQTAEPMAKPETQTATDDATGLSKVTALIKKQKALEEANDELTKQIKILQEQKKKQVAEIDKTNEEMTHVMDSIGVKKFDFENLTIEVRNYKAKVDIEDEKALPSQYMKQHIVNTPDKTRIYVALRDGQNVNGAKLIPVRKTIFKEK